MINILFNLFLMIKFKKVRVHWKSRVRNSVFYGTASVGYGTKVYNSRVGHATYIGRDGYFMNTTIGSYCSIGSNIRVVFGNHPTKDFVSTHPAFYSRNNVDAIKLAPGLFCGEFFDEVKFVNDNFYVDIGSDVWIGDNVIILNGIKIGHGAVIAAGSVVTKNVKPYEVVAGAPAKLKKTRFDAHNIKYLLDLEWWNRGDAWLQANKSKFSNVNKLSEIK